MIDLAIIVAVIVGLGQVLKSFIPSKFMPLVSLGLGIVAGIGYVDGSIHEQIFIGIAMGLAASGAFDVAKLPKKIKE